MTYTEYCRARMLIRTKGINEYFRRKFNLTEREIKKLARFVLNDRNKKTVG